MAVFNQNTRKLITGSCAVSCFLTFQLVLANGKGGKGGDDCPEVLGKVGAANNNQPAQTSKSESIRELQKLPGMERVVSQLSGIEGQLTIKEERRRSGLRGVSPMLHAVFVGNPGTGKTTVARTYAKMLSELGMFDVGGRKPGAEEKGPEPERTGTEQDASQPKPKTSKKRPTTPTPESPEEALTTLINIMDQTNYFQSENCKFTPAGLYDVFMALFNSGIIRNNMSVFNWVDSRWDSSEGNTDKFFLNREEIVNIKRVLKRKGLRIIKDEYVSRRDDLSHGTIETTIRHVMIYARTYLNAQRGMENPEGYDSEPGSFARNKPKKKSTLPKQSVDEVDTKANSKNIKEPPVVEVAGTDFLSPNAVQKMQEAIEKATGGVLIIDELYTMAVSNNPDAKAASEVLLKAMEDKRNQFVVIGTGYDKDMEAYLSSNPGFKRRFAQRVVFDDYDDPTLLKILNKIVDENDYKIDPNDAKALIQRVSRTRGPGFGNAGTVRNEFEAAVVRHGARLSKKTKPRTKDELSKLTSEDVNPKRVTTNTPLEKLNGMTGLTAVKKAVGDIAALLTLEEHKVQMGLPAERPLLNALFVGNPGTGKTTVATTFGAILKDLGYLSQGDLISVKASDLIGQYVGESEAKTSAVLERAKGKVLFIDEAYALFNPEVSGGGGNSFGKAAIDTLVSLINADGNQDMVVILAGYPDKISELMRANEGLSRRFPWVFNFEDYNRDQLLTILQEKVAERGLKLTPDALEAAGDELELKSMAPYFGNAGEVESLLGGAILRQSGRLGSQKSSKLSDKSLRELNGADFREPYPEPRELVKGWDAISGLESAKDGLKEIHNDLELGKMALGTARDFFEPNMVFSGGTRQEQDQISKELARLLRAHGVLGDDSVSSVNANDLIALYVGQTKPKTKAVLDKARGKTLLIKGVGSLSDRTGSYNSEAVVTLIDYLTENRGKMAVVFSDTPEGIERFFEAFPEARRMIGRQFDFDGFTQTDAMAVFEKNLQGKNLTDGARRKLETIFDRLHSTGHDISPEQLRKFALQSIVQQYKRNPSISSRPVNKGQSIEEADVNEALRVLQTQLGIQSVLMPEPNVPLAKPLLRVANAQAVVSRPPELTGTGKVTTPKGATEVEENKPREEVTDKKEKGEKEKLHIDLKLSKGTQAVMSGVERMIKSNVVPESAKKMFRQGEITSEVKGKLKLELGRELEKFPGIDFDKLVGDAIQEIKSEAQRLKKPPKNKKKRQPTGKYCEVCGSSDCPIPYYGWFDGE